MVGSRKAVVLAALVLVTGPALAGCMEDETAGDGAPSAGNASGDGSGTDTSDVRNMVRESLPLSGTKDASSDSETPDRISVNGRVDNGSGPMSFGILLDKNRELMVVSFGAENIEGASPLTPSKLDGTMIVGQHGKVTGFGVFNETTKGLAAWYNESSEPVSEMVKGDEAPATPGQGEAGSVSPFSPEFAPTTLLENVTSQTDANATWSASKTTHQGKSALQAHVHDEQDGVTYDITAIAWTDPTRLAHLNGSIEAEDPSDLGEGMTSGTFEMSFGYGKDAAHPHEEGFVRAASLTFEDDDDMSTGWGTEDAGPTKNYTIKPTPADGAVPLDEATALVTSSSSASEEPVLELPLEEATASNDDVELTYGDVDGDGLVSPGDTLSLTALGDEDASGYSLALEDEQTGIKVSPGAPLAAALAALGAGAAAPRRRR